MSREYPCVYHDDGKCLLNSEPGYTDWCVFGPCSHETPSNADHIRSMTDEELERFLTQSVLQQCPCPTRDCEALCNDCILNWLKQPHKEDNDGR